MKNEIIEYKLEFKRIKDSDFREFNNELIFIKCPSSFINELNQSETKVQDEGLLAYGYINKKNGICFKILGSGFLSQEKYLSFRNLYGNKRPILRKREVNLFDYIHTRELKNDFSYMEADLSKISKTEALSNNTIKRLRNMKVLDSFRKEDYPDVVRVKYMDSKNFLWVHYLTYRGDEIYGVAQRNELDVPNNVIIGFKLKRIDNFVYLKYEGHLVLDIKDLK